MNTVRLYSLPLIYCILHYGETGEVAASSASPYPCHLRAWAARLKMLSDLYVADLETEESCTRFSELTVL